MTTLLRFDQKSPIPTLCFYQEGNGILPPPTPHRPVSLLGVKDNGMVIGIGSCCGWRFCEYCNQDAHRCPGCGTVADHWNTICEDCKKDLEWDGMRDVAYGEAVVTDLRSSSSQGMSADPSASPGHSSPVSSRPEVSRSYVGSDGEGRGAQVRVEVTNGEPTRAWINGVELNESETQAWLMKEWPPLRRRLADSELERVVENKPKQGCKTEVSGAVEEARWQEGREEKDKPKRKKNWRKKDKGKRGSMADWAGKAGKKK